MTVENGRFTLGRRRFIALLFASTTVAAAELACKNDYEQVWTYQGKLIIPNEVSGYREPRTRPPNMMRPILPSPHPPISLQNPDIVIKDSLYDQMNFNLGGRKLRPEMGQMIAEDMLWVRFTHEEQVVYVPFQWTTRENEEKFIRKVAKN